MNNILILWLSTGLFLLVLEMFTGTFYLVSIALGAFIVGAYVWYTGDSSISLLQALIFLVTSGVFAYFLPKWFHASDLGRDEYQSSALDRDIGKTFTLKTTNAGGYKVAIEGIDYLVDEDCVTDAFKK